MLKDFDGPVQKIYDVDDVPEERQYRLWLLARHIRKHEADPQMCFDFLPDWPVTGA